MNLDFLYEEAIRSFPKRIHLCYFQHTLFIMLATLKTTFALFKAGIGLGAKSWPILSARGVCPLDARRIEAVLGVWSRPGGGAWRRCFLISPSYCSGRIHSQGERRRKFDSISETRKLIFRNSSKVNFLFLFNSSGNMQLGTWDYCLLVISF